MEGQGHFQFSKGNSTILFQSSQFHLYTHEKPLWLSTMLKDIIIIAGNPTASFLKDQFKNNRCGPKACLPEFKEPFEIFV